MLAGFCFFLTESAAWKITYPETTRFPVCMGNKIRDLVLADSLILQYRVVYCSRFNLAWRLGDLPYN